MFGNVRRFKIIKMASKGRYAVRSGEQTEHLERLYEGSLYRGYSTPFGSVPRDAPWRESLLAAINAVNKQFCRRCDAEE